MVNILCARNRYIVPFMFCSETSYDKLVEEIAKILCGTSRRCMNRKWSRICIR